MCICVHLWFLLRALDFRHNIVNIFSKLINPGDGGFQLGIELCNINPLVVIFGFHILTMGKANAFVRIFRSISSFIIQTSSFKQIQLQ